MTGEGRAECLRTWGAGCDQEGSGGGVGRDGRGSSSLHVKQDTEDDLLVVGAWFDLSGYGSNVEVSKHLSYGQKVLLMAPQLWQTGSLGGA